MEYDFSRIRTEYLRIAVDNQKKGFICNSITCCDCPFREFKGCYTNKEVGAMFEKELYRRDHPYTTEEINKVITEETMEEYKEITLDWTVKEIMELDLDRVEVYDRGTWVSSRVLDHFELVERLTMESKYRYKLKTKEPARITQEMARDLRARVDNGGFKSLEEKYGRKVEIIGEEK